MKTLIGRIWQLEKKRMKRHVRDLCLIDKNAFGVNAWVQQNFECVLPNKFELSRIALHDGRPVGYLIASRYGPRRAHIHRVAVHTRFRRKGIGTRLLRRFEDACLRRGITEITLESLTDRHNANSFYERMGFVKKEGKELVRYLKRKGKSEISQRYSGFCPTGNILVYYKLVVRKRRKQECGQNGK